MSLYSAVHGTYSRVECSVGAKCAVGGFQKPTKIIIILSVVARYRASIRAVRLQAVLENHSMTLADIFEGDSNTLLGSKDVTSYLGHLQDGGLTQSSSDTVRIPVPDFVGRVEESNGSAGGTIGNDAPRNVASLAIAMSNIAPAQEIPRLQDSFGGADSGIEEPMQLGAGGEPDGFGPPHILGQSDTAPAVRHAETDPQGRPAPLIALDSTKNGHGTDRDLSNGDLRVQVSNHLAPSEFVSTELVDDPSASNIGNFGSSLHQAPLLPPRVSPGPPVDGTKTLLTVTDSPLLGGGGHDPNKGGDGHEREEAPTAMHGRPCVDDTHMDGLGGVAALHEAAPLPGDGDKRFGDSSAAPINNTTTGLGTKLLGHSQEAKGGEGVDSAASGGRGCSFLTECGMSVSGEQQQQQHQLSIEGGNDSRLTSRAVLESSPQTAYAGEANNHEMLRGKGEGRDAALLVMIPSEHEHDDLGASGAGEREDAERARNETGGSGALATSTARRKTDTDQSLNSVDFETVMSPVVERRKARIDGKVAVEPGQPVEKESITAGREELATAVALRITDADGTQYSEALVEVQDALMGTFGAANTTNRTTAVAAPRDGDAILRDMRMARGKSTPFRQVSVAVWF